MKTLTVYTDGGARGNPGPSASAFIVYNEKGQKVFDGGVPIGISTNNQAEYQAVRLALEGIIDKYREELPVVLEFRIDSKLVVEQLKGNFKIKNIILGKIAENIRFLIDQAGKVNFTHIPREMNREADLLVNRILDQ